MEGRGHDCEVLAWVAISWHLCPVRWITWLQKCWVNWTPPTLWVGCIPPTIYLEFYGCIFCLVTLNCWKSTSTSGWQGNNFAHTKWCSKISHNAIEQFPEFNPFIDLRNLFRFLFAQCYWWCWWWWCRYCWYANASFNMSVHSQNVLDTVATALQIEKMPAFSLQFPSVTGDLADPNDVYVRLAFVMTTTGIHRFPRSIRCDIGNWYPIFR